MKAIGVMAGLRDFAAGGWRASTDITAHRTTDLTVIIDHAGIAMKAAIEPLPEKTRRMTDASPGISRADTPTPK